MSIAFRISPAFKRWLHRKIGGHWNIGPVTIYGRNAMHYAVNVQIKSGWLCFKPPTWCFGRWWPAYLYFSPDATPQSAKWGWGKAD